MATLQGTFKPHNPEKYKGDAKNIQYRSGWELKCMMRFDTDPRVIWWASEELIIRYPNPIKKRMARYFPDFVICGKAPNNKTQIVVIEVKPSKERSPPVRPATKDKRRLRRFITEHQTYSINQAKWEAAEQFCNERGWKFAIWDEYTIGVARPK